MSCLVCFSSRLQRYSAFITFPFSDIVQGWHFSWMLFMSSKHQPPTVMSHCQRSLHTLLKTSTFGCLFDQSRDSQQKQPLWCVLWKPFWVAMGEKQKISLKLGNQRGWWAAGPDREVNSWRQVAMADRQGSWISDHTTLSLWALWLWAKHFVDGSYIT